MMFCKTPTCRHVYPMTSFKTPTCRHVYPMTCVHQVEGGATVGCVSVKTGTPAMPAAAQKTRIPASPPREMYADLYS